MSIQGLDIEGQHVVLRPGVLAKAYKDITWRVVLARGGFGCKPYTQGTAVFVTHVRDGEQARYDRGHIGGLATPEQVDAALLAGRKDRMEAKK